MFDEDSDESLDGSEDNTVDHDRTMLVAVRTYISDIKPLRHLHIQLDRTALPRSADGVFQVEVQFRTVECAVAFVDHIRNADAFHSFF